MQSVLEVHICSILPQHLTAASYRNVSCHGDENRLIITEMEVTKKDGRTWHLRVSTNSEMKSDYLPSSTAEYEEPTIYLDPKSQTRMEV